MRKSFASLFLFSAVGATVLTSGGIGFAQDSLTDLSDDDLLSQLASLEAERDAYTGGEELAPMGHIGAFIGYDSDFGPVLSVSARLNRFLTDGQSLAVSGERAEHGSRANFELTNRSLFDAVPVLKFELNYLDREAQDNFDFDSKANGLRISTQWPYGPDSNFILYGSYAREKISNVGPTASRLIFAEQGQETRRGVGMEYNKVFGDQAAGSTWGAFQLSAEFGKLSDVTDYKKLLIAGEINGDLGAGFSWTSVLRAGNLNTRSGASRIGDRFMLGSAVLRGFEYGGIGPRDLRTSGKSALGGERYAAMRIDVQKAAAFGLPEMVKLGVFVDAGSLWKTPYGAEIDSRSHIRSAGGISLSMSLGASQLVLDLASPIKKQSYDLTRVASLRFNTKF